MRYSILLVAVLSLTGCKTWGDIKDFIEGEPLKAKDCLSISEDAAQRAYKSTEGDIVAKGTAAANVAKDVYTACIGE
jgi:hypothetical protein